MGRPVREFAVPSSVEALKEGLPIRVGPGANPKIILRSETFVELGDPTAGSCAFVLWTDTPSLIRNGRITLIGPDVQEARGASPCPSARSSWWGAGTWAPKSINRSGKRSTLQTRSKATWSGARPGTSGAG